MFALGVAVLDPCRSEYGDEDKCGTDEHAARHPFTQENDTEDSCSQRIEYRENACSFRCCIFLAEWLDRKANSAAYDSECKNCAPFGAALRQPDLFENKGSYICEYSDEQKLLDRDRHKIVIFCSFVRHKNAERIPDCSAENQKFSCRETDVVTLKCKKTDSDHCDDR